MSLLNVKKLPLFEIVGPLFGLSLPQRALEKQNPLINAKLVSDGL